MATAYDAGVNFFDNAEVYASGQSEEIMGAALKKLGWRRSSYLVSTKFFWGIHEGINEKNTLNRKYLLEGIDGSLKRFGLEHVDLVFAHRPDAHTPIEESVWAMHNIVESGKAIYWGTSEWPAADILAAIELAERHHLHKPVMEQCEYNMLHRERVEVEYRRVFDDYGYGATIWSPLASGLLTGKYNKGIPAGSRGTLPQYEWLRESLTDKRKLNKVEQLQPIAADLGISLARMALAWCLKNPDINTVITGASKLEQLTENLKATEAVGLLTADVMERIRDVLDS